MAALSPFAAGALDRISRALGECVSGGEVRDLLAEAGISDASSPGETKWRRLHAALSAAQRRDRSGAPTAKLIEAILAPARFTDGRAAEFEEQRARLNEVLSLSGLELQETGRLTRVAVATTLTAARRRSQNLRRTLVERNVHGAVLSACSAEIASENYFHTVLEATKSVAEKIRTITGLTSDGRRLADDAFACAGGQVPVLAFNRLESASERSEHTGMHHLISGIFGAFRNPLAHEPRHRWPVSKADALDLLQTISLIHRRLEEAHATPRAPIYSTVTPPD